ncbi:CFI-box-CTERM domain-containing protein [Marinobacter salarius]|uniref:CFI-box-CTERM domain-containing protein n=1 Tax=Marinobacter salarius TaxID=1420917 RepID=UPI000A1FBF53|nr:CFI-box-CTERM domain-containing protein [Marinobacter salarius]
MSDKKDPSKSPRDTNGPVVKTGPTAGKNRSRNKDGKWRRKKSDSGKPREKKGCFLTTAACSYQGLSDDCFELETLRNFRDAYLMSTVEGRALVHEYYEKAPKIASNLTEDNELQEVWSVINLCVEDINTGQYVSAQRRYYEMVIKLETRYLSSPR